MADLLGWFLVLFAGSPQVEDPAPRLRQTGIARGHTDQEPRQALCERAEDSAWRLVWRSCDERHRLENVETGACATVDYRAARDDGRGPLLEVRVQVEYDCVPGE